MSNDAFYITGGTLPLDADSYIVRRADSQLLDGLRRGEFCYVLNTRQMGKSSLMVRTARRLRDEGSLVVVLDLTAIGQNLTVEQWYFGLLCLAAAQTEREDDLIDFWKSHRDLGPMQRFVESLRRVLLSENDVAARKLIVFVDEIDAVRSLPFSADEFFAGIRECYNRRPNDHVFNSLTFCLLGVATPADLIRDTRISPFNIGRRIELRDFTPSEVEPLAQGLISGPGETSLHAPRNAHRLLHRILHWTNGHPYMTQRLCQAVAEKLRADAPREKVDCNGASLVDGLCDGLFLTQSARETDDNLNFVSSRLLQSEADVSALLDLYEKVRAKRRIYDNETDPLCSVLRLSGVVTVRDGVLRLRNRIYAQVFDSRWVRDHLPDAERRRQQQAYWRGIVRATLVGAAGIVVITILAGIALNRAAVARRAEEKATQQEKLARGRLSRLYVESGIRAMTAGNDALALPPLVEAMRLEKGDSERMPHYRLRFAAAMAHLPRLDHIWFAGKSLTWAQVSPDGRFVAAAGDDGLVHLWDKQTHDELPAAMHHDGPVVRAAFSPDGTRLVTCGADARARVWSVPSGRLLSTLSHPKREDKRDTVLDASWSRDGTRLATAAYSLFVVWNVGNIGTGANAKTATTTSTIYGDNGASILMQDATGFPGAELEAATLAPDGKRIVIISNNYRGWMVGIPGSEGLFPVGKRGVDGCWNAFHTEFSADGERFLTAGVFNGMGGAGLFEAKTGKTLAIFGHGIGTKVRFAAFGPGERQIVTAGDDRNVRIWDARTGNPITPPLPHRGAVTRAAFSSDGGRIVTGSDDGTVSVWSTATGKQVCSPIRHAGTVVAAQFTGDDRHLLTASRDGTARLWTLPAESVSTGEADEIKSDYFHFPSRGTLIQIGNDARMAIRDVSTGDVSVSSPPQPTPFSRFRFSGNRRQTILSGRKADGDDSLRNVQIWDTERLLPLSPVWKSDDGFLSHDGKSVLLMDKGGTWRLVDSATGAPRIPAWRDAFGLGHIGYSEYFTPDDRGVVQVEDANTIRLLDMRTGVPLTASMGHDEPVFGIIFSPDGRYLFTITRKGNLRAWNVATGAPASAPIPRNLFLDSNGLQFAPGGNYAISLSEPYARVWEMRGKVPLHPRRLELYNTRKTVISPDGEMFVALDQNDWLWRFRTADSITPSREMSRKIVAAVFSDDSRFVLTVREDGIARVWNVETLQPVTPALEQGQSITTGAFSHDGRMLATVSRMGENNVRVWDTKTGDALMIPCSPSADITRLAFSPDDTRLFALGRTPLRSWSLPTTSESVARLQAHAYLLSGQRIDSTIGSTPVGSDALRAAWSCLQEAD